MLLLTMLPIWAADLTGKWTGAIVSGGEQDRPILLFLELKVDGSRVTGTIGPDESRGFPIEDVTLAEGKLTFRAVAPKQGTIVCELTVEDRALRGTAHFTNMADGASRDGKVEFRRPE